MRGAAPSDIERFIATRLRDHRIALGISQMALGQHIGITYQQVQKYENGKNRISIGRAWRACRYLEVSMVRLIEEFDELGEPAGDDAPSSRSMRGVLETSKSLSGLPVSLRDSLRHFIQAVNHLVEESAK